MKSNTLNLRSSVQKWLICFMLFIGSSALFAQNSDVKINGVVIDELGEAMIGVTVVAEGSTVGTVTDFDGAFSLNVPGSTKNIIEIGRAHV